MDSYFDHDMGPGPIIAIVLGSIIGGTMLIIMVTCVICLCIKRKNTYNQTTFSQPAPVVVTSATHTAPGGYPVTQMPVSSSTTAYQTHVYAAPYPPQGAPTQMPMPMPMQGGQPPAPGLQPYGAPYPQMSSAANMNPPSYDMAVNNAGPGMQNTSTYEKQAPYNPNY